MSENSYINRDSGLHQMFASRSGGDSKKDRSSSKKFDLSVLTDKGHRDYRFKKQSIPKKSRGKETSKHFGVRFRPDLHKWVAEIRVAEWKSVDKKVWLGTFDTEIGAARAVDAARKLLKCKKKRAHNCPCMELNAYSERIPSHLNLQHLEDEAMFKDVTLFIKRKAQEYAASFCIASSPFSPEPPDVYREPKMEFASSCELSPLPTSSSSSSFEPWTDNRELIDSFDETMHVMSQPSWDDNTLCFDEFTFDDLLFNDPENFLQPDFGSSQEQAMDHSTDEVQDCNYSNDNNSWLMSGNPFQKSSSNIIDPTVAWSQPQFYPYNNCPTSVQSIVC